MAKLFKIAAAKAVSPGVPRTREQLDVHIPGCPPRPEALIHAFMTLQRQIDEQKLTGTNRPRHLVADAPSEFPVPQFGEHDLVPSKNAEVWQPPKLVRTK
jgi:NADH-quinone oxidoreductase subunit B